MIFNNENEYEHFYDGINENHKIRFSVSTYAASVIESDRYTFDLKRSTILNKIILNMCERESTISCVFAEWNRKFQEYNLLIDDKEKAVLLADAYIKDIENTLKSFRSKEKESILLGLNKEVFEYLTQESEENRYYGDYGIGKFITNIVEEYSQLSYAERELILNKEWVDIIEDAISKQRKLSITISSGNNDLRFDVKPVSIVTNKFSSYSYLVGISRLGDTEYKTASFRLSRIKTIKKRKEKSFISHAELKKVMSELTDKGVSYLIGETESIKVALTEEGKRLYDTLLAERPSYTSCTKKGNIYVMDFECTEKQAHDYFWKLGKNAKVVAPERLKQKLAEEFNLAAKLYKK